MSKVPDHMKGINDLPSTKAYNEALSSMRNNVANRTAENAAKVEALRLEAMADRNEQFPLETNAFGPKGTLSKQINGSLQRQVNDKIAKKAPKHATLHATRPSTCLEDLTWKDGVATALFYRGGSLEYTYEMDREEFLDWASDPSLGKFGNENVF